MWILWSAAGGCYCIRRQHVLRFLQEAGIWKLWLKIESSWEQTLVTWVKTLRRLGNPWGDQFYASCATFTFMLVSCLPSLKRTKQVEPKTHWSLLLTTSFSSGYHRSLLSGLIFMPYFHVFSYIYVFFLGLLGDIVLEDVFYCQHSACFASRFLQ